ncbi:hypothetical protein BTJ68_13224 [Hortaea werneckii EXF-2000]|uniref:Uncharacterized protein n=1 Tax=Hortaea werneckii EXF-2000 TaxID=1157616 RepID=A0A1Z5SQT2_HORWE|nr:hypothetical protein BTJ68_13224 [Hortaea werneckii EXF-2000]
MRIYTKRKGVETGLQRSSDSPAERHHRRRVRRHSQDAQGELQMRIGLGASAKHVPQKVGLGHVVHDEDVVSIIGTKSGLAAK